MMSLSQNVISLDLPIFSQIFPFGTMKQKIIFLPTDLYLQKRNHTNPIGEMPPSENGELLPHAVMLWCSLCAMESVSRIKKSSADIIAPQDVIWWIMQRKKIGITKYIRMFRAYPLMALNRFSVTPLLQSIKAWRTQDLWIVLWYDSKVLIIWS